MELLLVFGVVLLAGVLLSGLADRSVLSTTVLFLLAGVLAGSGGFGFIPLSPGDPVVNGLAELALFAVLFTDGMRVAVQDLRRAFRLPGRALLLGMPVTFAVTAALAHYVAGFSWESAFLIGAVLAPTDPVFASAIVGRSEVPGRLRHLLNVESGLNDGLALPVVLVLIALRGSEEVETGALLAELAGGLAIGVVVPLVAVLLLRSRFTSATSVYEALTPVAIGIVVLALCELLHANLFLGAFSAGITIASTGPELRDSFHGFGELISELLKLAAVLVFGALISLEFLGDVSVGSYVFAVLALFVARPVAIALSLFRTGLPFVEQAAVAWFGPKGFASVVYGLIVLESGVPDADAIFHVVAVVIALSIVLHSSTDVPLAHAFARRAQEHPPRDPSRTLAADDPDLAEDYTGPAELPGDRSPGSP